MGLSVPGIPLIDGDRKDWVEKGDLPLGDVRTINIDTSTKNRQNKAFQLQKG